MNKFQNCCVNINEEAVQNVQQALAENSISGKGPFVEKYEKLLAGYFQSPYALSCSNATAGITMILMLENIKEGDEVMLPPTAPVMCVLPVIAAGAKPVFIDTADDNFNLSISDIKLKRTSRTRLLMNVPMWGYANNIEEIAAFCTANGIKLLEDNSHCHGTRMNGTLLGNFGDYAVFSTHERKLITTGEGGFLLVKHRLDYEKLLEIRSFGEVARSGPEYHNIKGSYGYFPGLNFRLSSINAALGIAQLSALEQKISQRRSNAAYLIRLLESLPVAELPYHEGSHNNYYSVVFVADPGIRRAIESALAAANIISDPWRYRYCPLYKMPLFSGYANACPNAERLIESVFTLPVHEAITEDEMASFKKIVKNSVYEKAIHNQCDYV